MSIAAPVGPIGVLCIRRTLAHGRKIGLASGFGAASADMVYGLGAAFGLSAITAFLLNDTTALLLRIVGGAFLLYLGISTFRSRPTDPNAPSTLESGTVLSVRSAYLSTFGLTLTNPATIIAFMAIFAGLGVGDMASNRYLAWVMVLGVTVGSALWWLALTAGVSLIRHRLTVGFMRWVNWVAGVVLAGFGMLSIFSAF